MVERGIEIRHVLAAGYTLGPGAKIIGDIEIGDDCVIGANAVVIQSVPRRSVVAGIPARVIKSNIDIAHYMKQAD